MIRSFVVAAVAALSLSGCALLASPEPVQLYRFGHAADTVGTPVVEPIRVKLREVALPQASQGDRLLGITGTQVAYIGGARWVSPANQLFGQSLEIAFASEARKVGLIGRRELTPATRLLDVDVQTFETRYETANAVPVVVITARARLLRFPERTVVIEQTFTAQEPAAANRVSAIVDAYDLASRDLNSRLVAWTDDHAGLD